MFRDLNLFNIVTGINYRERMSITNELRGGKYIREAHMWLTTILLS